MRKNPNASIFSPQVDLSNLDGHIEEKGLQHGVRPDDDQVFERESREEKSVVLTKAVDSVATRRKGLQERVGKLSQLKKSCSTKNSKRFGIYRVNNVP